MGNNLQEQKAVTIFHIWSQLVTNLEYIEFQVIVVAQWDQVLNQPLHIQYYESTTWLLFLKKLVFLSLYYNSSTISSSPTAASTQSTQMTWCWTAILIAWAHTSDHKVIKRSEVKSQFCFSPTTWPFKSPRSTVRSGSKVNGAAKAKRESGQTLWGNLPGYTQRSWWGHFKAVWTQLPWRTWQDICLQGYQCQDQGWGIGTDLSVASTGLAATNV